MEKIIYQDEGYKAEFFDNTNEKLITENKNYNNIFITFNFYGQKSLSGKGWGGEFWNQQGCMIIAITTKNNDWYHNLDYELINSVNKYIKELRTSREIRLICGYGTSMGAFAAILFSDKLAMHKVIAFSPQYSISESWDTRWKFESDQIQTKKLIDEIKIESTEYYLFYDPHDLDRKHIEKYKNKIDKKLYLTKIRWSGHPACTVLSDGGILHKIVEDIIENQFCMDKYDIKEIRKKSRHYYINMARKFIAKQKYDKAIVFIDKALEMGYKFFSFLELKLECILKIKPTSYIEYLKESMKEPADLGNHALNYLNLINKNSDELLKYYQIQVIEQVFIENLKDEKCITEYKNFIYKYKLASNYAN